MRFDELLFNFQKEITTKYGKDGIVKIALEPEVFEQVVMELKAASPYAHHAVVNLSLRDVGELYCNGIQILCREKDKF